MFWCSVQEYAQLCAKAIEMASLSHPHACVKLDFLYLPSTKTTAPG